ncbi:MAG: hypothetical protein R2873_28215 [Caldilineaceae bacterium]|nr:hypothetical protein [Caldilineaceae bacterium]
MFGPIALFGSGETSPGAHRIHRTVMEDLEAPIRVAIVETPAGFELNADGVAAKIGDYLSHRLQNFQPAITQIPARKRGTDFSPDDPAIAAPIFDANYLFIGPGSPSYAARQLRASYTWYAMQARHRLGAALCFSSASTLAAARHTIPVYEIYKVGEDLHWKPGLDFFGAFGLNLVIVPHWNNNDGGADLDTSHCYMGLSRYEQLIEMLPAPATVLGIEENTGLVIHPHAGVCEVVGPGRVLIIRDGVERSFATGQTFAPSALGDWRLPEGHAEIPAEIWEEAVRRAEVETEPALVTVPPSVLDLVQQREDARQQRDWAAADALRDQIAAAGWLVRDTPDGPQVDPSAL